MKLVTIQVATALILATVLAVLADVWLAPAVGVKNSACDRHPPHLRLPIAPSLDRTGQAGSSRAAVLR